MQDFYTFYTRCLPPLGTKLYFHVNSWRKNYIVLTFNIITFSRGCKPRITSYLINCWFNLTCYHATAGISPGICSFVCSWWSTHHPRACRKRQFPIPELLINLIYVFWGYIFSRAKLISINFSKLNVLSLILIKLALSYLLLVCALNNPVAIFMSKILGNNCY